MNTYKALRKHQNAGWDGDITLIYFSKDLNISFFFGGYKNFFSAGDDFPTGFFSGKGSKRVRKKGCVVVWLYIQLRIH